jgi:AraC-like DNA-binding protein/quercetin dioxygenase-like cupin family protein
MYIHEQVEYEHPLLSLRIWQSERAHNSIGKWHYHKEHEFICVLDGTLEMHLENEVRRLQPGDVMLIGSNQAHRDRFFKATPASYICMQTDLTQFFEVGVIPYLFALSESKQPISILNYVFDSNADAKKQVFEAIVNIYNESTEKQLGYELAIAMAIKKIMLTLIRGDDRHMLNLQANDHFIRLQPVLEYIDEHLEDRLLVEKSSQLVNMSYYYFVKFFKRVMGISFTDFVQQKRIHKAERLLLTSELSIMEIGEEIGMQNMSHFYKLFKRINGHSPNDFRKKRRA